MRLVTKTLAAALSAAMILTTLPLGGFDTASAQPIMRRPPPGGPGPGFRPGGPGPGARRPGNNGAAAGAAFGILAGALIGSAIQAQQQQQYRQPQYDDGVAYCASRYRSYDPYSQTFVGYDGRRYRCP